MPTTATPPPSPPTLFPRFNSLPPELRLRIWTFALPPPRLIPLHYHSLYNSSFGFPSPPPSPPSNTTSALSLSHSSSHLQGCTSPTPIPSPLHATHESRSLFLRHYTLSLNPSLQAPKIYLRPSHDILFFGPRPSYMGSFKHFINATAMISAAELATVTHLAVSDDLFRGCASRRSATVTAPCLRDFWAVVRARFTGVQEVCFVPDVKGVTGFEVGREDGVWEGWRGRAEEEEGVAEQERVRFVDGARDGEGRMGRLYWEVVRAVAYVEERWGWEAPAWKVMRVVDGERSEEEEAEVVSVRQELVKEQYWPWEI